MNGTPSPRRGWRAARKREKTITVTIANTYRSEGEKSRENIASMYVRPLVVIYVVDQQAAQKSMATLLSCDLLLKHLFFPQQVRKSFQATVRY